MYTSLVQERCSLKKCEERNENTNFKFVCLLHTSPTLFFVSELLDQMDQKENSGEQKFLRICISSSSSSSSSSNSNSSRSSSLVVVALARILHKSSICISYFLPLLNSSSGGEDLNGYGSQPCYPSNPSENPTSPEKSSRVSSKSYLFGTKTTDENHQNHHTP